MKARIFTLLSAMVIFIGPIYSQNDWWEELDLPMDTIYVANCEDIENVINTQYLNEVFNHWIFPENAEHENIVGNHKNQFTFDQGSNCIGAEWAITLLNWDNLEQYEYDRIFKIEPSLPGPCGMHFTYDEHKAEAGISIADLDPSTDSLSFSINGIQDSLFLTPAATDTFSIAIFHNPGSSLCFVSIEVTVEPPCEGNYIFEAKDEIELFIATDFCTAVTLEDAEITADYECSDFTLGFLRADGSLSNSVTIPYTPNNPNRTHHLTLVMRTDDGEEYTRPFDVIKTADDFIAPPIFVFSDNPYLTEGETTYLGVGGDMEDVLGFQGEIILLGAKVIEVSDIHPSLHLNNGLFYHSTDSFFKFSFLHSMLKITTFDEGLPWFVLELEATRDGYLSELIDIENTNNYNEFILGSDECNATIVFNFPFILSQQLIFSNTTDLRLSESIELYPNPTTEMIYFDMGDQAIDQITIFDLNGRIIKNEKHSENWVDVSGLQAGYYHVILQGSDNLFRGKFIKK